MLPVAAPCRSTTMVYVPVTGRRCVSRNPLEPKVVMDARVEPSGRSSERDAVQQDPETPRLTRWLAVPANVISASCPGVAVVTVSGAPPGTIVPDTSAGGAKRVSVTL